MALLSPDAQWCPLDGPPLEDWLPDRWIGPHVGLRLCDAFKTLSRLPLESMGSGGGFWPAYIHEYEDLLAQEQSDLQVKDDRAAAINRIKLRPTSVQISQMYTALCWAGTYVPIDDHRRLVQRVALLRARDLDIEAISRRMRIGLRMLRDINRNCLDRIASGLRRDGVEVF